VGKHRLVETAPLLAKLGCRAWGGANSASLLASLCRTAISSPVGSSSDRSEPVHRLALGILASRDFATGGDAAGYGGRAHRYAAGQLSRWPAARRPDAPSGARACRSAAPALCSLRSVSVRHPGRCQIAALRYGTAESDPLATEQYSSTARCSRTLLWEPQPPARLLTGLCRRRA